MPHAHALAARRGPCRLLQRQALAASRATAQSADEANNRANQKRPNANATLAAAQQAAGVVQSGTEPEAQPEASPAQPATDLLQAAVSDAADKSVKDFADWVARELAR